MAASTAAYPDKYHLQAPGTLTCCTVTLQLGAFAPAHMCVRVSALVLLGCRLGVKGQMHVVPALLQWSTALLLPCVVCRVFMNTAA
jgi:hypothetical protein